MKCFQYLFFVCPFVAFDHFGFDVSCMQSATDISMTSTLLFGNDFFLVSDNQFIPSTVCPNQKWQVKNWTNFLFVDWEEEVACASSRQRKRPERKKLFQSATVISDTCYWTTCTQLVASVPFSTMFRSFSDFGTTWFAVNHFWFVSVSCELSQDRQRKRNYFIENDRVFTFRIDVKREIQRDE